MTDDDRIFDDLLTDDDIEPFADANNAPGIAFRRPCAYVDIVFVLDCTGSMRPLVQFFRRHAKTIYRDIEDAFYERERWIQKLRLKVIAFRDYYFDYVDPEHPPMAESDFFTMPDDLDAYERFLDSLECSGGEDEPESALEALHHAFHSDWQRPPEREGYGRQVVMLFTDAPAHPLDDRMRDDPKFNAAYPQDMPRTLEELEEEFMSPEVFPANTIGVPTGRRLVLFAPENLYPWSELMCWESTICITVKPGEGLSELDMNEITNFIAAAI